MVNSDEVRIAIPKKYWPRIVLSLFVLVLVLGQTSYYTQFQQLPSPLFGGDYYRDRGFVLSVMEGYPPWMDGYFIGELQYYPYLVFGLQGYTASIFGLEANTVMYLFAVFGLLLSALAFFLMGKALFKNEWYGVLLALLALGLFVVYPSLKGAHFGYRVLAPLFIWSWIRLEQEWRVKNGVWKKYSWLAGLFLGLDAFVHGGSFSGVALTFAFSLIGLFCYDYFTEVKKKRDLKKLFLTYWQKYWRTFVLSVGLALLFFGPHFLRYGFDQPNPVTKYADPKLELRGIGWIGQMLANTFFSFSSFTKGIVSLLSLVGAWAVFTNLKNYRYRILAFGLVANLLVLLSPHLTRALFNSWLEPSKMVVMWVFGLGFTLAGVHYLSLLIPKINKHYATVALLILLIFPLLGAHQSYGEKQWVKYAITSDPTLTDAYDGMGTWMQENLPKDAIILGHDETSFALTGVSGRKVFITRRTHASYYVDVNERIAQTAVIVFGSNDALRDQFIEENGITHVYFDQNLFSAPMKSSPEYASLLDQANISYVEKRDRLDPALTLEQALLVDIIEIAPKDPAPGFQARLEPVFVLGSQENPAGIIYKIN